MKKLLSIALLAGLLLIPQMGWAADAKISALTAKAVPDGADSVAIVNSADATKTYKTTIRGVTAQKLATVASSATPTPNADTTDFYTVTALAEAATFGAPTGTPVQGQRLTIRIKDDGTARALGWNAIFVPVGVVKPSTTVISKLLYVFCIYNATSSQWDMLGVSQEQ
jgi:hypothetical protein